MQPSEVLDKEGIDGFSVVCRAEWEARGIDAGWKGLFLEKTSLFHQSGLCFSHADPLDFPRGWLTILPLGTVR